MASHCRAVASSRHCGVASGVVVALRGRVVVASCHHRIASSWHCVGVASWPRVVVVSCACSCSVDMVGVGIGGVAGVGLLIVRGGISSALLVTPPALLACGHIVGRSTTRGDGGAAAVAAVHTTAPWLGDAVVVAAVRLSCGWL